MEYTITNNSIAAQLYNCQVSIMIDVDITCNDTNKYGSLACTGNIVPVDSDWG